MQSLNEIHSPARESTCMACRGSGVRVSLAPFLRTLFQTGFLAVIRPLFCCLATAGYGLLRLFCSNSCSKTALDHDSSHGSPEVGTNSETPDPGQPWQWLERHCSERQMQADAPLRRRHQKRQGAAYSASATLGEPITIRSLFKAA